MQIPNQIPWDSHHGPRPGSSSSLNTQFVHYNKATTYLNRSRTSSLTWSPLLASAHPKLDALGQQSPGNTICALDVRAVSSLPSYPASPAPPDRQGGPAHSPIHPSNSFITKAPPSLKTTVRECVMCIDVNTWGEGGKKLRHRLWRKAWRNTGPLLCAAGSWVSATSLYSPNTWFSLKRIFQKASLLRDAESWRNHFSWQVLPTVNHPHVKKCMFIFSFEFV